MFNWQINKGIEIMKEGCEEPICIHIKQSIASSKNEITVFLTWYSIVVSCFIQPLSTLKLMHLYENFPTSGGVNVL